MLSLTPRSAFLYLARYLIPSSYFHFNDIKAIIKDLHQSWYGLIAACNITLNRQFYRRVENALRRTYSNGQTEDILTRSQRWPRLFTPFSHQTIARGIELGILTLVCTLCIATRNAIAKATLDLRKHTHLNILHMRKRKMQSRMR